MRIWAELYKAYDIEGECQASKMVEIYVCVWGGGGGEVMCLPSVKDVEGEQALKSHRSEFLSQLNNLLYDFRLIISCVFQFIHEGNNTYFGWLFLF